MKPPVIDEIRKDDDGLFVSIEGAWTKLATFRENLWRNGKVMLPPPYADRCEPQQIAYDPDDEDSVMIEVDWCVHDLWAAGKMRDFAAGKLPNGTHRRK